MMFSFLIPTYNKDCKRLASELSSQVSAENIEAEIVVMDDGSTEMSSVETNMAINDIAHCSFIRNENNMGRAKIRNRLADVAKYESLVFLDADVFPSDSNFVHRYVEASAHADVVCGGLLYRTGDDKIKNPLRLRYGLKAEVRSAAERNLSPYSKFSTANFMVKRDVMQKYPFDESIIGYGYEDTLFGRELMLNGVDIMHIDNQVYHDDDDTNITFLQKIRVSIQGLVILESKISDHSRIIVSYQKIRRWHLDIVCSLWYVLFHRLMELNLLSDHPSCKLFNIYKMTYFCYLKGKNLIFATKN